MGNQIIRPQIAAANLRGMGCSCSLLILEGTGSIASGCDPLVPHVVLNKPVHGSLYTKNIRE